MNLKGLGFVVVAFIVVYNLATGSAASSTDTVPVTISPTWVQAGVAILALIVSVYTFWQQKKMTRRQINLALYEKRYKIYRQVLAFTEEINRIHCPNRSDVFKCELFQEPTCVKELEQIVGKFCSSSWEREFLLPKDIRDYIDLLLNSANVYHKCLSDSISFRQEDWALYVKRVENARKPFILKGKEIYEKFHTVLDFTNL